MIFYVWSKDSHKSSDTEELFDKLKKYVYLHIHMHRGVRDDQ